MGKKEERLEKAANIMMRIGNVFFGFWPVWMINFEIVPFVVFDGFLPFCR